MVKLVLGLRLASYNIIETFQFSQWLLDHDWTQMLIYAIETSLSKIDASSKNEAQRAKNWGCRTISRPQAELRPVGPKINSSSIFGHLGLILACGLDFALEHFHCLDFGLAQNKDQVEIEAVEMFQCRIEAAGQDKAQVAKNWGHRPRSR